MAFCRTWFNSGLTSALILLRMGPRPIAATPLATFPTTLPTFFISFPKKFSNDGSICTDGEYWSKKVSTSLSIIPVLSREPNSRPTASTIASDSRTSCEKRVASRYGPLRSKESRTPADPDACCGRR